MLKTKKLLTYEDYLIFSDDNHCELLNGELFMVPSPDFFHQSISRNLEFLLWDYVKRNSLGLVFYAPFDIKLSIYDIVQPDIIYVSNERNAIVTDKNITGAPDLVVEILSPGTRERDILFKKNLYARHGVKEYWIADPVAKNIEVMVLKNEVYEIHGIFFPEDYLESPLIPGFSPSLQDIFNF